MKRNRWRLQLTFTEDLLASTPMDEDVYVNYLANEALDKELDITPELGAVRHRAKQIEANGDLGAKKTVFLRDSKVSPFPLLSNHVIKGFCKEACRVLIKAGGEHSRRVKTAYRTNIDTLLFVSPRLIPIRLSGPVEDRQDPLRADTPQGTRVALAWREYAPARSSIEFEILALGEIFDEQVIREWLDYGALFGLGTWRTGGFGTFTYTLFPA